MLPTSSIFQDFGIQKGEVVNRRRIVFMLTLVAVVAAVNVVCQAQPQTLLTRHVREVTLNGQAPLVGQLPATQSMRIDVVLALRHQPELENFLQELYDPSSPSYRHFVTVAEFTARFGPSQEDYDALIRFAQTNGFKVAGGSRDAMDIQLTGSVAVIEKAFHVTMGVYQHPTENRTFYAPDREPTVDLPFQLWHISGLDSYSIPRPAFVRRNFKVQPEVVKGSCPKSSYCGSDMRAAYYGSGSLNGSGQTLGLLEYSGYDITDLNNYFKNAGQTDNVPVIGISTDGTSVFCENGSNCDAEQILDMTQSISMAPGMAGVYVYVGSTDTAILGAMSTNSPLNAQLSASWTWSPPDPGTDDPYFEKFAAQGQNYFQAAGDDGSYSPTAAPTWPSLSQYVTTVGGTDLQTTGPGGAWSSETAWVDGGGGYTASGDIPIPAWQQLPGVINSANKGSTKYRNAPDVAAESNFDFYVCANGSCVEGYGGTSFATPMWAGFMALVNQQVVANGDPTLGFINPAVYNIGVGSSYDSDFHDITSGSNGYPAVTGYDLATGWGSPNGTNLINALAGPAGPNFTLSASPNSVTITQGSNGTSTITITPLNGFSGNVTLSASGLPSGVTAGFNPNPAASTSTLTLTASGSAATGTVTVTITGTSGSLTNTTTLSLTVNAAAAPNFSLTANPSSVTVTQGNSGTSTITVNPVNGFTGSVTLSASGLPSGVTAGFSPNPTTTTSTLTLTASASAATGTVTVTVKGVSGSLTNTTTLSLTVNASGSGPAVTLSPTSLSWGTVKVGTTTAPKTVTLTNTGTATLTFSSVTISGDFALVSGTKTCGNPVGTVAAGKTCNIKVTFTPKQTGLLTGAVTINDNAPNTPQSIPLSGTGK
jgi:subtilase family serine protease